MPNDKEQGIGRYLIPAMLAIIGSLSVTSVVGLWNLSSDVKVIKAAQQVNPVTVAQLEIRVQRIEDDRRETIAQFKEDMQRLREWMRNHTHGGQVNRVEPNVYENAPAATPAPPNHP